jgi:hypothetical protein
MRLLLAMTLVAATVAAPVRGAGNAVAETSPAPVAESVADPASVFDPVVELGRVWVAERLIELGRPAEDAWGMATQLTIEDILVLSQNPDMMQPGGADPGLTLLLGVLLIAGLIALAYAGDGFILIGS